MPQIHVIDRSGIDQRVEPPLIGLDHTQSQASEAAHPDWLTNEEPATTITERSGIGNRELWQAKFYALVTILNQNIP